MKEQLVNYHVDFQQKNQHDISNKKRISHETTNETELESIEDDQEFDDINEIPATMNADQIISIKVFGICVLLFSLVQIDAALSYNIAYWYKTELVFVDNDNIPNVDFGKITFFQIIDDMMEADEYFLAVLGLIFVIILPTLRCLIFVYISYTMYVGLSQHNQWSRKNGINYFSKCDRNTLLPWENEKSLKLKDFLSIPGRMRWASRLLDMMQSFAKMSFAKSSLSILTCASASLTLENEVNGDIVSTQIAVKIMYGYLSYIGLMYLTFFGFIFVSYQETRYLRGFRQKMVHNQHNTARLNSGEGLSLEQPLLADSSPTRIMQTERSQNFDIAVKLLLLISFVAWFVLSCNTDIITLNAKGTFLEFVSEDDRKQKYGIFSLIGHDYSRSITSSNFIRVLTYSSYTSLVYVFPTITMFMCYVIECFKAREKEDWYRKLVGACFYFQTLSCNGPGSICFIVYRFFGENITTVLLNPTEDCKEETCLATTVELPYGYYFFVIWAVSSIALLQMLMNERRYIIYRL